MAAVNMVVAGWNTPNGSIAVTFDNVTLVISLVIYTNSNPSPATVILDGTHMVTIPANASGTVNISAINLHMNLRPAGNFVLPVSLATRYPA